MEQKFLLKYIFLIVFLLLITTVIYYYLYIQFKPNNLVVNFLDIGQGDATLIITPKFYKILIDVGPDLTILSKLSKYLLFFDNKIDFIILTHPDIDHLAGIVDVLKRYKVGAILFNGVSKDHIYYQEFLKIVYKKQIPIFVVSEGQVIKLSDGVNFKILSPSENLLTEKLKKDDNLTSIVAKLIYNNNSFLFTGDAPDSLEKELLKFDLKSDILKVAHHGSKTSSSIKFLETVKPIFSVISVGINNKYGHPYQIVLERLKSINSKILRTDINGDIQIISDGSNLIVNCQLNC